jgi:hypothetical protein
VRGSPAGVEKLREMGFILDLRVDRAPSRGVRCVERRLPWRWVTIGIGGESTSEPKVGGACRKVA